MELFHYNWQVRDEWFVWCKEIEEAEWTKERIGGMKSFKETLLHIIDAELTWANYARDTKVIYNNRESLKMLEDIRGYSEFVKIHTKELLDQLPNDPAQHQVKITTRNGKVVSFSLTKILQHIVTHEIHHIGQLSVWARELGKQPVNCDLIIRTL